jgi:ABC-2 type transport system ATP-binding protein
VIRGLKGRGRTVVITTHYMDEAERLCDRVAVIDKGKVIALGTPRELITRIGGEHVVEFSLAGEGPPPPSVDELSRLPSVSSVREEAGGYLLTVGEPHLALPALLDFVRGSSRALAGVTTRMATLEDVFVTLTGRHLRDDDKA